MSSCFHDPPQRTSQQMLMHDDAVQVGVLTDITARKSTAEAMHLCDKALAATSEATLITDSSKPDNPIIYCNEGFSKLFGEPLPASAPSMRRTPVKATSQLSHPLALCSDCRQNVGFLQHILVPHSLIRCKPSMYPKPKLP